MSAIKITEDLFQCVNALLNKVKLEHRNGEELLNGLLNVSLQAQQCNMHLLYGNLIFDRMAQRNLDFFENFNNPYFCKNIIKHLTIGRYNLTDGKERSFRRGSGYYGQIASQNTTKFVTVNDMLVEGKRFNIKRALDKLKKTGVSVIGQNYKMLYTIDKMYNVRTSLVDDFTQRENELCSFSLSVAPTSKSMFASEFLHPNDSKGELGGAQYDLELTARSAGKECLLSLYTCGLIGNLNIRTDLLGVGVTPHELILGIFLRHTLKDHLYACNEYWRGDEEKGIDTYSSFTPKRNSGLGVGMGW